MSSYPQPSPPTPTPPSPVTPPPPPAPVPAPAPQPLPLRHSTSIQGNVLAAYNKDHQCFLLYRFADQGQARLWLGAVAAQVAATETVEDYNDAYRAARAAGATQAPTATWINVGLTAQGLEMLTANAAQIGADLIPFTTFAAGPAAHATALGDTGASDPTRWQFGGSSNAPVHAVVTVAADATTDRDGKLAALDQLAQQHNITLVYRLDGDALAGTMAGHEHFGHKDGISQPGVRDFHEPDPANPGLRKDHPGTPLIAAGEFILGYPDEGGTAASALAWMRDGSFQVLRQVAQDVPSWHAQMHDLRQVNPSLAASDEELQAKLMGRWPSGRPLALASTNMPAGAAPTATATDPDSNAFDFTSDPSGTTTPLCSHIRKTNPRADRSHRILRRGIPFGPACDYADDSSLEASRGLLFNAYVANIDRQFEFLLQSWANNPNFSGPGVGRDPVLGDVQEPLTVHTPNGGMTQLNWKRPIQTLGCIYAFAPSLPVLQQLAQTGQL